MKATSQAASPVDVLDAPKPATKAAKKSPKLRAVDVNQFDMFSVESMADDFLAAADAAEAAEVVQAGTDTAVASNPELIAALDGGGRDALDFARFMRSANVPRAEVQAILAVTAVDAEKVMAQLAVVEGTLGIEVAEDSGDIDVDMESDAESDSDSEADSGANTSLTAGDSRGADTTSLFLATLRGKRFDPPTESQWVELAARVKAGDMTARDEIVNRNMRYMVTVARKYIKTGRPFDDLIQAGAEGLMVAALKYDPAKGRFTTIAAFWIRQRIQRSVRADSSMPIPSYLPGQEAKLMRMAAAAETPEEKEHLEGRAAHAAKRLESRRRDTVSLDASRSGEDEEGADMLSMMASEATGQEERQEQMQIVGKLQHFAEDLPDRARGIFMMRIGLHPNHLGDSCTLAEISTVYHLSRERSRQIYSETARDVANSMEVWAKGAKNLPTGFRKGLMNPGKA